MHDDRVTATYHVETAHPLLEATGAMAGEQSSGTFVDVPGETEELRERHAGRVEEVVELGTNAGPSGNEPARGRRPASRVRRGGGHGLLSGSQYRRGPAEPPDDGGGQPL